ncbi:hypothetical protein AB4072_11960 [Microvirga sp. 2MCAF38]|uniref:hypothetical protein n=1 Tax=Microvirga sp. 2MCAF38 TaxID=3232989 RepID=UPI003F995446
MTFRLGLSAVFGLALAASVALKVPGVADIAAVTESTIPDKIATVLRQDGFQVRQDVPDYDLSWVSGVSGSCNVLVAPVAPQGWHRSLITQVAKGNPILYIVNGQTYAEQPILRTRAQYYWSKLNRYLGLSAPGRPVIAVIAPTACERLPLDGLAALSMQ